MEKRIIDLRSDTITRPTPAMLDAMMNATVGDDVFGDDPTVNALETKAAGIFGKEAGLFCPSGTMTNQIAMNVHTHPGDEVICDESSHVYRYEGGGMARNSGASVRLLQGDRGRFKAEDVIRNINPANDPHFPLTRLVVAENTSNRGGGSCYELADMQDIGKVCREKGLACHLDGARLFNALVRKGQSPLDVGDCFDSISICLSKGLGAPVGSVLTGTADFISKARRVRKVFGGGMRQAGYLAAAGIYALDHHIERLRDDHKRAAVLADTLSSCSFVKEVLPVETNILVFKLVDEVRDADFMASLNDQGLKGVGFGPQTIRFVTHLDFDDEMLDEVIRILRKY